MKNRMTTESILLTMRIATDALMETSWTIEDVEPNLSIERFCPQYMRKITPKPSAIAKSVVNLVTILVQNFVRRVKVRFSHKTSLGSGALESSILFWPKSLFGLNKISAQYSINLLKRPFWNWSWRYSASLKIIRFYWKE